MSTLADLHRHLDRAQAFGPVYGPGYSNHLPMALHAAWELGADSARLEEQLRREAAMLQAAAPPGAGLADWREGLGDRSAYAGLRAHIRAEIGTQGAEAVIRSHLPVLISAPHAALFHGMIRTAHAWESGHEDELSSALASWASAWNTLPGGSPVAPMDLASWQQALLRPAEAPGHRLRGERLAAVARSPAYAALCDALAPESHWALRREQLIRLALEGYLRSGDFVLLHLITGLRALCVLAPFVPDWPDIQTWITRGFTAAWLGSGAELRDPAQVEPPAWSELHRAALAQFDDHVLKLVHACWQEDRIQPDARWRQAAALSFS
jgi:hypothetical protein